MSDQHIEGLRKAARRTFWEAKQLESKAGSFPDLSDEFSDELFKPFFELRKELDPYGNDPVLFGMHMGLLMATDFLWWKHNGATESERQAMLKAHFVSQIPKFIERFIELRTAPSSQDKGTDR